MARYIITVNRDAIDKGSPTPIRIEDTRTGDYAHARVVRLPGPSKVVHGDPRQDGATVWIETDAWQ